MNMKRCLILVSLVVLAVGGLGAQKTVTVAFGLTLPPYVFEKGGGMEFDIIKRSLELKGYTLKPVFVPFARVTLSIQNKSADAAATVNEGSGLTGVFYSESHITYQNVVVALADKKYAITKVGDLAGKSILSFQNAASYLGNEFATFIEGNKKYSETPDQEAQVAMLYLGRADTLVVDINIFKYYRSKNTKFSADQLKPETVYGIFSPTRYKVAFRDQKLALDFNAGLAELRSSGEYDRIVASYVGK